MTLKEAIRHAESKAKTCEWLASNQKIEAVADCERKCGEEHRQLAEWLRELQRYQWIPISERLPHDGEKILACYDDGYMLVMQFYAGARFSFIAWMPLPKPWKGADDE